MKLTKKEIYDHFTFAVEVEEEDGYRYWIRCDGYENWEKTSNLVAAEGKFSDADICTHQSYPGMQEFYNGYFEWECNGHLGGTVNDYYDTVYAVS